MFSVKLNGSLYGYFNSGRGLRQGGPLSPFLFVMTMKVLSRILLHSSTHWDFSDHWRAKANNFTHLCFVDDILVFCKGDLKSVKLCKPAFLNSLYTLGCILILIKATTILLMFRMLKKLLSLIVWDILWVLFQLNFWVFLLFLQGCHFAIASLFLIELFLELPRGPTTLFPTSEDFNLLKLCYSLFNLIGLLTLSFWREFWVHSNRFYADFYRKGLLLQSLERKWHEIILLSLHLRDVLTLKTYWIGISLLSSFTYGTLFNPKPLAFGLLGFIPICSKTKSFRWLKFQMIAHEYGEKLWI